MSGCQLPTEKRPIPVSSAPHGAAHRGPSRATTVPGTLHDIDFMVKDSKRFRATGGWGYAQFNYDVATDTFTPLGTGSGCGYACHTTVKAKDYVFTAYGKR